MTLTQKSTQDLLLLFCKDVKGLLSFMNILSKTRFNVHDVLYFGWPNQPSSAFFSLYLYRLLFKIFTVSTLNYVNHIKQVDATYTTIKTGM